jgi:hypothetical protein
MPSGESSPSSREVFIQISADLVSFLEAILATLSHEISHKYLEVNRVSWAEGPANHYHNEVPTDITAIFPGQHNVALKRLASAVQLRPWPPNQLPSISCHAFLIRYIASTFHKSMVFDIRNPLMT